MQDNSSVSMMQLAELYAHWNDHLPDPVFPGGELAGNSGYDGLQLKLLQQITDQLGHKLHKDVALRDVRSLLGTLYHQHLPDLDVIAARWLIDLGRTIDH
ncbi:hypothetical protein OAS86_00430 [Gammaproteobacteria bacterium]|nr:hypothetical protein [Gammaproteobacteria bacterium]